MGKRIEPCRKSPEERLDDLLAGHREASLRNEGAKYVARTLSSSDSMPNGVKFFAWALLAADAADEEEALDALSAAQGLETLHVALGGTTAAAVPGQIEWALEHLVRPDGRVAYQVHRGWTDWREFPRWSSAPVMSALAGVAAREGST